MDLRVGAYAVIIDERDRLLLTRWSKGRAWVWTLPGGGVELGEPPEQGVR